MNTTHRLNRQSRSAQQTTSISPTPQSEPTPVTSNVLQRVAAGPVGAGANELRALGHNYGNRALNRLLQRTRGTSPQDGELNTNLSSKIEQARSGGKPLDKNVGAQFSSAMNTNLSNVRVHTDAQADSFNQDLSSQAFTVGNDIFFSQGSYQPESTQGKQLLAHELTHVAQQSNSTQPRVQCLRIHFDRSNFRWRKAKESESQYIETTAISKNGLFTYLEEIEKQDDGAELVLEILDGDVTLAKAWKEYKNLGSELREEVWRELDESSSTASSVELLEAITNTLSRLYKMKEMDMELQQSSKTGSSFEIISIQPLSKSRKTKHKKKDSKKDNKASRKKTTKDKTSDTISDEGSTTTYTEEEIWLGLDQLEKQAEAARFKLEPVLERVKLNRDQIIKLHEMSKTDTTIQDEINILKKSTSKQHREGNLKRAAELEHSLFLDPNMLSEVQKFRRVQIKTEEDKSENLELDLKKTLLSVGEELKRVVDNLFILGKLAKDFKYSKGLLNTIGRLLGRIAGLFMYGQHDTKRPTVGEIFKHILSVIDELELPIKIAGNLDGDSDPESTNYTAISTITEAPQSRPDGSFQEPSLRKEEKRRRKRAQEKDGLNEEDALVQARLEMILIRINEAYHHTKLQSMGYEGNVLSVFVGPEWFFGSQKICTPKQKDKIIEVLLEASLLFPHMLIVPGTILWSENGKRVHNTAPVIINGKLKRAYSKKSWGGDPGGKEMLERGHESNLFKVGNLNVAIDICADHFSAQAKQEYYSRNKKGQGVDLHIISAAGQSARPESVVARPGGSVVIADVEGASGTFRVGGGSTHEHRNLEPQGMIGVNPGGRSMFSQGLMELGEGELSLGRWESEAEYNPKITSSFRTLKTSDSKMDDESVRNLALQCLGYLEHVSKSGSGDKELLSEMKDTLQFHNYIDTEISKLGHYVAREIEDFLIQITLEKEFKKRKEKIKLAKQKVGSSIITKDPSDLDTSVQQMMLMNILDYVELHIQRNKKAPLSRLTAMKLQLKEIVETLQGSFGKMMRLALYVQARLELVKPKKK